MLSEKTIGRIIAIIGAFSLSFGVLLIKTISVQKPFIIMANMWTFTIIAFIICFLIKYGPMHMIEQYKALFKIKTSIGPIIFQTVEAIFFIWGITVTDAATLLIIFSTNCLQVGVISHFSFNSKLTSKQFSAIFVGFSGICTMVIPKLSASVDDMGAYVICLASSVGMAWFLISTEQVSKAVPEANVALLLPLSGILIVILGVIADDFIWLEPIDYVYVFIGGFIISPLAFGGFAIAATKTHPAEVSLISLTEVILAPVWTFLFLDERPDQWTTIGGMIILMSVVAFILCKRESLEAPLDSGSTIKENSQNYASQDAHFEDTSASKDFSMENEV